MDIKRRGSPVLVKKIESSNPNVISTRKPVSVSMTSPVVNNRAVVSVVNNQAVIAEVLSDTDQHVEYKNQRLSEVIKPADPVQDPSLYKAENAWFKVDEHDAMDDQGNHKRILVIIPAWKDNDCFNTIADLYTTAAVPGRVHVLVIYQHDFTPNLISWMSRSREMLSQFFVQNNFPLNNTHWLTCSSDEIRGFGTVRRLGWLYTSLLETDYVMSIDAHSRFALAWDTYSVGACQELVKRGYSKPCLSALPWAFEPEPNLIDWVGKQDQADTWTYALPFFNSRLDKVAEAWKTGGFRRETRVKTVNPFELWDTITPISLSPGKNPVRGVDGIELKFMGYSNFGLPWYQGQFLADYRVRLSHPEFRNAVDVANPGYRIAGGYYFMPAAISRTVELSTFMRSDDEVMTSLRLLRSGVEIFTPNKSILFHWYERPGLPRPSWQHDTLMLSSDCISSELRLLGFSFDWRSEVRDLKAQGRRYADGFLEETEDLVFANMQGVRVPALSMDQYFSKIGVFPPKLLCRLNDMECSGKRALRDIDYVMGEYVRPFHLFTTISCTSDISALEGNQVTVEMVDAKGQIVGSANANLSKNTSNQDNIQIVGGFSIKLTMVVFCYPNKNIPRSYSVCYIDGQSKVILASSQLFTPRMQAYLSGF